MICVDASVAVKWVLDEDRSDLARALFRAAERAISQIRSSQAAPTGVSAGFMNYSHYYRLPSGPRR